MHLNTVYISIIYQANYTWLINTYIELKCMYRRKNVYMYNKCIYIVLLLHKKHQAIRILSSDLENVFILNK